MASRTSTVAAGARRVFRAVAAVAAGRTAPVSEPVSTAAAKAGPARKRAATRKRSPAATTAKATAKKAAKKTDKAATVTSKAPIRKAASTNAPTKSAHATGTTATKGSATKAAATKATARKAPATKATARKAPATKTTARKAPATKATARKAPATKATAKKAVAKKAVANQATATSASSGSSSRAATLRVREDESPWTPEELREVRSALEREVERLSGEISQAESGLQDLLRDSGDGAGDDQADAGAKTFEREQEITLANNSREMLLQTERALARIADGSYGECESCGNPIGKLRLQVFPRATLCVTCKQRQERR
jgi:RNA polymerase-binding protein DksA